MKISLFIFLGFLTILIMFSITTYINFQLSNQVNENSEWLSKSTVVVRSSNRFQRNVLNMVSFLRGYMFTGENYFMQAYDSAVKENRTLVKELKPLISKDQAVQLSSLQKIESLSSEWLDNFATPLINAKRNSTESDSSLAVFNKFYRSSFNT